MAINVVVEMSNHQSKKKNKKKKLVNEKKGVKYTSNFEAQTRTKSEGLFPFA
jgi:hypothetical protein